jgi:hypothetical protein
MHTLPKGGTPWTLPPLPPSPRQSRLDSVVVINPGKGNVALPSVETCMLGCVHLLHLVWTRC